MVEKYLFQTFFYKLVFLLKELVKIKSAGLSFFDSDDYFRVY